MDIACTPKSPIRIYEVHKGILKDSDPDLPPVNWDRELPDNREALGLLIRKGEKWLKPQEPIYQLDRSDLDGMICKLAPQIEWAWGHKFSDAFEPEIVAPEHFLARINEYLASVNSMFGYGSLSESPPTVFLCPTYKTLVVPDMFVIKKPELSKSDSVTFYKELDSLPLSEFGVIDVPWDRAFLEEVIAEDLSLSLFRQARSEWGEGFVEALKAVGPEAESSISRIGIVSAQIAKEKLCAKNPQWRFYVGVDALTSIWGNRYTMRYYAGLDALSQTMTLMRASMVDYVSVMNNAVSVEFCTDHPSYSKKKEAFGKA
jgi:hypothetical protein